MKQAAEGEEDGKPSFEELAERFVRSLDEIMADYDMFCSLLPEVLFLSVTIL